MGERKYKHVPKKRTSVNNTPRLDYKDASNAWFCYKGQAYSVKYAPMQVLGAAILALAGTRRFEKEVEAILFKAETDMAERWWLLCAMIERKTPLPLYKSKQEAMHAC